MDFEITLPGGYVVRRLMLNEDFEEYERLVKDVPDNGVMMEIGVFVGGSLACLAPTIKQKNLTVIAVDIFDAANYNEPRVMTDKQNMRQRFDATMLHVGLEPIVIDRTKGNVLTMFKMDLVFVDADHSYESCKKDIEFALSIIKPGGVIAGHDFDLDHPGVLKAVHEAFGNKVFPHNRVWSVRA